MAGVPFVDELHDPTWSDEVPPMRAGYRVDLTGCTAVTGVASLDAPVVVLTGCSSLRRLPALPAVVDLDLTGCAALEDLDGILPERLGRLDLTGCAGLDRFPDRPRRVAELDLCGTPMTALPADLVVDRCLAVDRPLDGMPTLGPRARVTWRGVPVPPAAVADPGGIDPTGILGEANAEVRRALIELVGYERFLDATGAEAIDADTDPGGPRRLLRLDAGPDPNSWTVLGEIVCLEVRCPSTGRRYVLRVPPTMTTCRRAAAWVAGFDDPADYHPVIET